MPYFFTIFLHDILDIIDLSLMSTRASRSASKALDQKQKNKQAELPAKRTRTPVKQPQVQSAPTKKVKKQKPQPATTTQNKKAKNDVSSSSKKQDQVKKDSTNQTKKQFAKKVENDDQDGQKVIKKVTMCGTIPVDAHFARASQSKVLQKGGVAYATTLNQSNVMHNNNKFYILQILQSGANDYTFFCRWGRVGVVGQTSQMRTSDVNTAIRAYEQKVREKTRGGYRIVQMNYENDNQQKNQQQNQKKEKQPEVSSQLPKQTQDLIRLIFDMKMMNNQMKQIGYDAKKMPLGKLSKSSIQKGYQALNKLMQQVKGKKRIQIFQQYSNDFFSYIPHDFGFIKMQNFILNTQQKIKQKLQMLQSLQDIQVYTKILNEGKISSDMSQIDSNYLKLKTEIKPVDKNSDLYKKLIKYVKNTHASTHNNYSLEVEQIYRLDKQQENTRYKTQIPNKQLLWHGSRLTNFVGILSQGLRIAPPEAPVTGYMFGKGVYFADMVSKSANYCCTSKANNTGLMLLCQVALGNCWQKFAADYYASNLPPGMNSTKGVGRTAPKSGEFIEGAWVPNQQGCPTGANHASLLYNQFIVYDVAQIKSKFLFKMKFNYN